MHSFDDSQEHLEKLLAFPQISIGEHLPPMSLLTCMNEILTTLLWTRQVEQEWSYSQDTAQQSSDA